MKTAKRIIAVIAVIATVLCYFALPANAATEDIPNMGKGWYWPLQDNFTSISSRLGYRSWYDKNGNFYSDYHQGIDIFASNINGQPVYAARKGTVAFVGTLGSAGNIVSIKHGYNSGNMIYTTYMHLSRQTVKVGQNVDQNTLIGFVGATGGNYSPHLHFQICKNDKNPAHNNNNDLNSNYFNPANISYSYIHPVPARHKVTVSYFSNYADKSFSNPLYAVGSDKNVRVKTITFYTNDPLPDGIHNYTAVGTSCYLGRTGYTATGYWNTKADGSGKSVHQDTAFANGYAFAKACGVDASNSDVTIKLYPQWKKGSSYSNNNNSNSVTMRTLTVNYYSNYADKSFSNPKNVVGSNKNVCVKTINFYSSASIPDGLHNYTAPGTSCYLGRTGYTATGYWNTKPDGSGKSIHQDTAFSNCQALAKACGIDPSKGNATINLYPQWKKNNTTHTLTVNYYSNYANKSFSNPKNAVGSNKNVCVKTIKFYSNVAIPDGLHNYTAPGTSCYLGRTGYTATGYWNTRPDGSGKYIHQDTAFSNGQALAKACGVDISNGNATVNLYPVWR